MSEEEDPEEPEASVSEEEDPEEPAAVKEKLSKMKPAVKKDGRGRELIVSVKRLSPEEVECATKASVPEEEHPEEEHPEEEHPEEEEEDDHPVPPTQVIHFYTYQNNSLL